MDPLAQTKRTAIEQRPPSCGIKPKSFSLLYTIAPPKAFRVRLSASRTAERKEAEGERETALQLQPTCIREMGNAQSDRSRIIERRLLIGQLASWVTCRYI